MKIRTRFALSTVVFVALLCVLSALMLAAYRRVGDLRGQVSMAVHIEREANDLAYLSSDYMVNGGEYQLLRLKSEITRLSDDVERLRLEDRRLEASSDGILVGLERLRGILGEVAAASQDRADPDWSHERWSRIAQQSREITVLVERLSLMLQDDVRDQDKASGRLAILSALAFAAYIIIGYLQMRRVTGPIAGLQHGAAVVGSGDLEFRIREDGHDELTELARAFNRMSGNLKVVTASKAEIEKEVAERTRVEEALRVSESVLRSFFDATGDMRGIIEVVGEDEILHVADNAATAEFLGLAPEALQGKLGSELGDSRETLRRWIGFYEESRRTGRPVHIEFPYRRGDKEVWFSATVDHLGEGGEGRPRFAYVVRDITERKLADVALRQLAQFPEENPNPVFRTDSAGNVIFANAAGVALLTTVWNWRAGSVIPDPLRRISVVAYEGGRHVEEDLPIEGDRALSVSAVRPKGENYVNLYIADITKRKRAEQDLRDSRLAALNLLDDAAEAKRLADEARVLAHESEERLAKAQEIAHLGSWELDHAGNRLTWSAETYRILGIAPDEFSVTYDSFLELVHPDDRRAVDAAWGDSVREGRDTYEIEHRIIKRSTGEIRVVRERCVHIKDDSGKIVRSVGMVHDITEAKRAEEEMKQLTESMEQFAYIASHDLQEPLRVITSYCQLLEKRYKDQIDRDGGDFIEFIIDGATRMQKLILDLLAYSRIGHKDSPLTKVDCADLVRRVVSGMEDRVQSCGAEISIGALPVVKGHESTLTQLFQNLISNALKFRGSAPPRVEISARQEGISWLFSVRDNGIGIDPRHHDRIFVIFQRLHSRTRYPGTGIGLAICRKVVENHGGTIWVDSEPGKGSTFHFTIPVGGKHQREL